MNARYRWCGHGKSERGICGSLVKDHDHLEMSGDNDETQTPEETSVDEKVPLQRLNGRVAAAAALTLL